MCDSQENMTGVAVAVFPLLMDWFILPTKGPISDPLERAASTVTEASVMESITETTQYYSQSSQNS